MSAPEPVVLEGDIDLAVREDLQARLDAAVAQSVAAGADVQVDLGGVTFIDSTGLSCLVVTAAALADHGRALRLCNVPPTPRRLLELAGLDPMVVPTSEPGGCPPA